MGLAGTARLGSTHGQPVVEGGKGQRKNKFLLESACSLAVEHTGAATLVIGLQSRQGGDLWILRGAARSDYVIIAEM